MHCSLPITRHTATRAAKLSICSNASDIHRQSTATRFSTLRKVVLHSEVGKGKAQVAMTVSHV